MFSMNAWDTNMRCVYFVYTIEGTSRKFLICARSLFSIALVSSNSYERAKSRQIDTQCSNFGAIASEDSKIGNHWTRHFVTKAIN